MINSAKYKPGQRQGHATEADSKNSTELPWTRTAKIHTQTLHALHTQTLHALHTQTLHALHCLVSVTEFMCIHASTHMYVRTCQPWTCMRAGYILYMFVHVPGSG